MEQIKNLLKSCGLSEAIPVFKRHKMTVDQLEEMCSDKMYIDDMKELLPALGDRLKLKKAIKERNVGTLRLITKPQKKSEAKLAPTKKIMKNDPKKKAFVVQMLKNDQHLAELYQFATKVLIEFSLFSFDGGCRPISPDWTLIDFADGSLNCLLCKTKIRIQTRPGSGMLWNVGNYKRHFIEEHKNDKSEVLGTEGTIEISSFLEVLMTEGRENETLSTPDGTKALTSTELEDMPKCKEQPAGSNSECNRDSVVDRCSRKRSAPDSFNETILKRVIIVDISSGECNVPNRLDAKTDEVSTEKLESMKTDPSSSNGKDVGTVATVVSGESVITEDIDGNSHPSKWACQQKLASEELLEFGVSDQFESDTGMSNTSIGGMSVPTSDGVVNQADELTADTTTENLYENTKTEHKTGEKVSKVSSAVTLTPNTLNGSSEPMVTEVTPTRISNKLNADIFDGAKLDTETMSTGLVVNKVDNVADAVLLQEIGDISSTSTNPTEETTALNDWPTLIESEQSQLFVGTMRNVSIASDCGKIPTAVNSFSVMGAIEPVETHQNLTAIEQTNQEKLALEVLVEDFSEQATDDILSDVSKQLDTDTASNNWTTLIEPEEIQLFSGTMRNVSISSDCDKIPTAVNSFSVMEATEPVETHQNLTAVEQTNQQKLALEVLVEDFSEQGSDNVLSDVSQQLDTYTAIIDSNVTIPDGKTSTFDTDITIATTSENNEEEKLSPVPEWRKIGVKFGWARKRSNSKFYPGYLLLNKKFRWITTKAELSSQSFKPIDFSKEINQDWKNKTQIRNLREFNKTKEIPFE